MIILTKEWAEDSVWLWKFRTGLSFKERISFDWWVDHQLTRKRRKDKKATSSYQGELHGGHFMIDPAKIPEGFVQSWDEVEMGWKLNATNGHSVKEHGKIQEVKNNNSRMDEVVKPEVDEDTVVTPEEEVEAMHEDVKKGMEEAAEVSHAKSEDELEDNNS